MEYKVVMPILSDTMDKGILGKWYVKVGDVVKKGDKLAEIESDKAVMDIQSFHDGIVKEILAKENDEVKVKSVIAIIDTNQNIKTPQQTKQKEEQNKNSTKEIEPSKIEKKVDEIIKNIKKENFDKGVGSPLTKQLAKKFHLDLEHLQKIHKLPNPTHQQDIINYLKNKYFTKKALLLLNKYNIEIDSFNLNHKITESEIQKFIIENELKEITPLSPNQIAINKNLENSLNKPSFFIFEEIDAPSKNITPILIKSLAKAMKTNPLTRSILNNNSLITFPSSNISVAVHRDNSLYMIVLKNAEEKSIDEIKNWLKEIKTKYLSISDLKNSTFGISNLGMYDIESFSALINDKDSGIMAVGAKKNGKIKLTFTFDHRIINGVEAANFVNDLKKEIKKCMM